MTTDSSGGYIVEAKDELPVQICLLIAAGIVKVLPYKPSYDLVTSLTKKTVAVPKHSRLAKLTGYLTVVVSMVYDTKPCSRDAQVKSVNAVPIYGEKVTKEDLACRRETVVQQD